MRNKLWILGVVALVGLAACGDNDFERALSGAAVGALGASAVGGNPVTGAVVGGAAGALCDDAGVDGCQ